MESKECLDKKDDKQKQEVQEGDLPYDYNEYHYYLKKYQKKHLIDLEDVQDAIEIEREGKG
jgi:hypothetical protein